jgi:hypothetical protein
MGNMMMRRVILLCVGGGGGRWVARRRCGLCQSHAPPACEVLLQSAPALCWAPGKPTWWGTACRRPGLPRQSRSLRCIWCSSFRCRGWKCPAGTQKTRCAVLHLYTFNVPGSTNLMCACLLRVDVLPSYDSAGQLQPTVTTLEMAPLGQQQLLHHSLVDTLCIQVAPFCSWGSGQQGSLSSCCCPSASPQCRVRRVYRPA